MKQTIAFRVDSGSMIGSGHVMRCLTLASALRRHNVDAVFVCRPSTNSIETVIEAAGFKVLRLAPDNITNRPPTALMHGDFLMTSQESDALATTEALREFYEVITIIVDHYGIYEPWDKIISQKFKIYKIDDLADRQHFCQGLLDQNFYLNMNTRYGDLVPPAARNLIGPTFALIRESFADTNIDFRKKRETVQSVLISFGGMDTNGYGPKITREILQQTDLRVRMLGRNSPSDTAAWTSLKSHFKGRIEGPIYLNNPIQCFLDADIYIGAGGTITWERFACGLPGVVYSIAENQVLMAQDLEHAKFQLYGGKIDDFSAEKLIEHISELQDPDFRWQQSQAMRGLVDGHGVDRVIDKWGLA